MFNWPYAHLVLNHFPIILTYVGVAAVLFALVRRRRVAWLYAVVTLTLAGLGAYPAVLTGTQAAPIMEKLWYVDEAAVDDHEEAGERAMWVLLAMGALSAYSWWRLVRTRDPVVDEGEGLARDLPVALRSAVVVTALLGAAAVGWASWEGGMVVHKAPKIAAPPGAVPTPGAP